MTRPRHQRIARALHPLIQRVRTGRRQRRTDQTTNQRSRQPTNRPRTHPPGPTCNRSQRETNTSSNRHQPRDPRLGQLDHSSDETSSGSVITATPNRRIIQSTRSRDRRRDKRNIHRKRRRSVGTDGMSKYARHRRSTHPPSPIHLTPTPTHPAQPSPATNQPTNTPDHPQNQPPDSANNHCPTQLSSLPPPKKDSGLTRPPRPPPPLLPPSSPIPISPPPSSYLRTTSHAPLTDQLPVPRQPPAASLPILHNLKPTFLNPPTPQSQSKTRPAHRPTLRCSRTSKHPRPGSSVG